MEGGDLRFDLIKSMQFQKDFIKSKIKNEFMRLVLKFSHVLSKNDKVIWLLGDGRSGTTWVSDIINHDKKLREMFEPFHPKLVRDVSFILPHQYVRPNDLSEKIKSISSDIFSGKFINERVNSGNQGLLYNGVLVKDIFANLLCYSVSLQFPKVKPILLIRNPFAVALSKYKKKHWFWVTEPIDLLNQTALREDYLLPFEDMIRKISSKKSYLLNQILIWSIINYVPLRQFKPGSIHICFYESIYTEPHREISKIFEFIGGGSDNYQSRVNLSDEVINRPSRVTGTESNILAGTSPIISWKKEIPAHLIDDGLKILQHFGLHNLYDERSMPNESVIRRVHQ